MQIITIIDPHTGENINYYKIQLSEIDGIIDDILYKKIYNEYTQITTYYKRAYTGNISVKWFGAIGNGITDDTDAIETAINSLNSRKDLEYSTLEFDTGIYVISRPLTISAGVNLLGQGSIKKVAVGGVVQNHATIIRWNGLPESTMFLMKNVSGITIRGICFDTMPISTDADQTEMQISDITAIRYICRSMTRYNEISNCMFNLLAVGIHYFDDKGDNPEIIDSAADKNMDTNYIDRCEFRYCEVGVKVEQTNVYNAVISRSAFYGSTNFTKHHLLILKGHSDISDSFLGPLKDEHSDGGKNGVAVEVNQGFCNLYNIYAETHNAPFFVWNSALHEKMTDENGNPLKIENCVCNLVSCNVVAQTNTLPVDYVVKNGTSKILNIIGGEYSYLFCQSNDSTGAIVIMGTSNANVSESSKKDRVFFYGNKYDIPAAGSIADIDRKGGGKLHLIGETPEFFLSQLPTNGGFKSLIFRWQEDILHIEVPGYYNGIEFDFAHKILKMPGWTINYI